MAALIESKSARKHISTTPQVSTTADEFEDVFQSIKKELLLIKGLSEAKVEKIVEAATKLEMCNTFITGAELVQKRARVIKLSSGSAKLDELLGGGFESMSITELFGENRCGKTQICHTVCVVAQLPRDMNGGAGKVRFAQNDRTVKITQVCYIDTEGTFRPEKIHSIAERFGVNGDDALDNIMYARAFTTEHMSHLLTAAAAKMAEEKFCKGSYHFGCTFLPGVHFYVSACLIVDSIIALFRVDYCGRGELADRQQKLNRMLSAMMKLAEQYNLAVLLTNQVMADPGGGLTFVANPTKPVGGHVLGHASTTRLSLRKGKGDQRIVKVYDAPNLPESECIIQLYVQKPLIYISPDW